MSELSEHLKLQIVRHSMESEEEARQRKSELAAPSGYAALMQQWDGRIKALSDMQRRYAEQGAYAEAMVARAQWQMLITCCNDLKQHEKGEPR
jgi:hypothetical protein